MAAVTEAASHTPLAETDETQVPSRSCRSSSERVHSRHSGLHKLNVWNGLMENSIQLDAERPGLAGRNAALRWNPRLALSTGQSPSRYRRSTRKHTENCREALLERLSQVDRLSLVFFQNFIMIRTANISDL